MTKPRYQLGSLRFFAYTDEGSWGGLDLGKGKFLNFYEDSDYMQVHVGQLHSLSEPIVMEFGDLGSFEPEEWQE